LSHDACVVDVILAGGCSVGNSGENEKDRADEPAKRPVFLPPLFRREAARRDLGAERRRRNQLRGSRLTIIGLPRGARRGAITFPERTRVRARQRSAAATN